MTWALGSLSMTRKQGIESGAAYRLRCQEGRPSALSSGSAAYLCIQESKPVFPCKTGPDERPAAPTRPVLLSPMFVVDVGG